MEHLQRNDTGLGTSACTVMYSTGMTEYLFKVVVVGSSLVGKSSLILRYCDNRFSDDHVSTIGVDFRLKDLVIDGAAVKMQIWDTAGQERFRNIVPLYYRGAEGLIIIFDVTDEESFGMVPTWIEETADHTQGDCVIILVGNKTDRQRRVTIKAAQTLADKYGLKYLETSAKTSSNVQTVFHSLAATILEKKIQSGSTSMDDNLIGKSISLQSQELESPPGWCSWGRGLCYSE